MKRVLATAVALSMGLGVVACSKSAKQQPGAVAGPAWELSYKSTTPGGQNADLAAGYIFSVDADGSYGIAPANGGEARKGKLDQDDFQAIQKLVNDELGAAQITAATAEKCEAPRIQAAAGDQVTLARRDAPKQVLRVNEQGEICFQTKSDEEAAAIYSKMDELAAKHFSPSCDEAAASLAALSDTVRSCNTDADCSYVSNATGAFENVTVDSHEYLMTEACTIDKPIVAANLMSFQAKKAALDAAYANLRSSCGDLSRSECAGTQGFTIESAPVCQQNRCQMAPAAAAPAAPAADAPAAQ